MLLEDPQATLQKLIMKLYTSTAILTLEYRAHVQPDEANIHLVLFATDRGIRTILKERVTTINADHLASFIDANERPISATLTPLTTLPGDTDLVAAGKSITREIPRRQVVQ